MMWGGSKGVPGPAHNHGLGEGDVQQQDAAEDKEKEVCVQHEHVAHEHAGVHGDELQEEVARDVH